LSAAARVLVVDAANAVGTRPDGWWKDRAGAASRLLAALEAAVEQGVAEELSERHVVVVLEGRANEAAAPDGSNRLEVVRAARDGDTAIVDLVAARPGDDVLVVTSDRALRERVEALGAQVRGAGWLRDLLAPHE
jgi:rRNA-processing protein FCF1